VVFSGNAKDIATAVKQRYGALAERGGKHALEASENKPSDEFYTDSQRSTISDKSAGTSNGTGNPLAHVDVVAGKTVFDLGSVGGIDRLFMSSSVCDSGRVIGAMLPCMVSLARDNAKKLGLTNVVFKRGHIEQIPQDETSVDLVISNGFFSLSEWKYMVLSEMFRVLKPGGCFVISDLVTDELLPESIRDSTGQWVEGVDDAAVRSAYLGMIKSAGFVDIEIVDERTGPNGAEEWRHLVKS